MWGYCSRAEKKKFENINAKRKCQIKCNPNEYYVILKNNLLCGCSGGATLKSPSWLEKKDYI